MRFDSVLAAAILVAEVLLLLTLYGPQPVGWLWVGSQVDYQTGSVMAGIVVAFLGMIATMMGTIAIAMRLDHAWKLVRRAGGHDQKRGALNRIFALTAAIAIVSFGVWLILIEGPGSSVFPAGGS
jgi:hypothetical protein